MCLRPCLVFVNLFVSLAVISTEAYTGFWWGNLRERDHLGDPGINYRIILRWIFRKWEVEHGLDLSGSE
jgi:hypothetical protein